MPKNRFTKIICILFYIFVFVFLLKNSYNYLDPDLGWHLKVGEQILAEKQVPDINYYNYTLNGKKWVDHEWLSNAAMFWLYNNFGYLSLSLLFAFILLLVLIIQNAFMQKYFLKEKKGVMFIFIFQILGLFAIAPHSGVRVQEITLLNLLLLLIIIYFYEKNSSLAFQQANSAKHESAVNSQRSSRRDIRKIQDKNYKILFWLPPLFYFWVCAHAGFLIGLFVLFFWIGVKIVELIIEKYKLLNYYNFDNQLSLKHIKIFSFFAVLSVLTTFFTPYGLRLYSFLSDYKNTYYLTHIQEWLPINYLPVMLWQLLYSAIAATALILLIIFSFNGRKTIEKRCKINLWQIAISLLFLLLAFKSKRHFPLLFIASFPMMIAFFSNSLSLPKQILKQNWSKPLILIKSYLIIGLLIIIFITSININFFTDPFSSFCSRFPCQATEFLKENKQYHNLNIFNLYGWGGYLIWVWPEKQLFIDGRLPIAEFAGHTLFEEYHEFFKEEKVKIKLDQYDIKLVLLKTDKPYKLNWFEKYVLQLNEEKINSQKNHLKNYLGDSKDWQEVYSDKISKVYVKK